MIIIKVISEIQSPNSMDKLDIRIWCHLEDFYVTHCLILRKVISVELSKWITLYNATYPLLFFTAYKCHRNISRYRGKTMMSWVDVIFHPIQFKNISHHNGFPTSHTIFGWPDSFLSARSFIKTTPDSKSQRASLCYLRNPIIVESSIVSLYDYTISQDLIFLNLHSFSSPLTFIFAANTLNYFQKFSYLINCLQ